MKAEKIMYEGIKRIKVDFPYNQELSSLLKQIGDARWSRTHNAWHIPYTQEAFNHLKSLFPDIDYPKKKNELDTRTEVKPEESHVDEQHTVNMHITEKRIFIKLPKNEKDIQVIRSLQYSRWDKNQFCWVIPNYKGNADILKELDFLHYLLTVNTSQWFKSKKYFTTKYIKSESTSELMMN